MVFYSQTPDICIKMCAQQQSKIRWFATEFVCAPALFIQIRTQYKFKLIYSDNFDIELHKLNRHLYDAYVWMIESFQCYRDKLNGKEIFNEIWRLVSSVLLKSGFQEEKQK